VSDDKKRPRSLVDETLEGVRFNARAPLPEGWTRCPSCGHGWPRRDGQKQGCFTCGTQWELPPDEKP
jgi:hypothetical protein